MNAVQHGTAEAGPPSEKLLAFFRREIEQEESSGFRRLVRVPGSLTRSTLEYYQRLNRRDREAFRDYCAHWAHTQYGTVVGAPPIDHTKHPFFDRWQSQFPFLFSGNHSVPYLRSVVQQYKCDLARGVASRVTREEFEFASSVRSVKAPELKKRVLAALAPLGFDRRDRDWFYRRKSEAGNAEVYVDFGGRSAQLRYCVFGPGVTRVGIFPYICFERVLGFGLGDWDYIVEENVEDSMALFSELVQYCLTLPQRMREAVL